MISNEIILAIITFLSTIISAVLIYRQHKNEQNTEKLRADNEKVKEERNQHLEFTRSLMERVDKQDGRIDALIDDTQSQVKEITEQYESQLDKLKKEMEKLRFDATMEVSVWRDRYFNLMDEYQQLKVKHNDIVIESARTMAKLAALEIEHNRLIAVYRPRTSPDIEQTA